MRFEDSDTVNDGDVEKLITLVSCSICFDDVTDNGERSWAKLACGHRFHLDCIGSAFNMKGAMQCPNCRKIEKGQWLYESGCRSSPEFSVEDGTRDEDLYDLSFSEMSFRKLVKQSFGVHWCPFSGLQHPSSLRIGELSSTSYHDQQVQHAIFAEQTSVSSPPHPSPYVAYIEPVHPSSNPSWNVPESSNFNCHWNSGPSIPVEIPTSYAISALNPQYHSWERHSTPMPPVTQTLGTINRDVQRSGPVMHPVLIGHSSGTRAAGSLFASSTHPPYAGSNARTRDRVQALQAYYQQLPPNSSQSFHTPMISRSRRSVSRNLSPSSNQTSGFYVYPSSQTFQDREISQATRYYHHYHPWEREHLPSFPFHQLSGGSSDSSVGPRSYLSSSISVVRRFCFGRSPISFR